MYYSNLKTKINKNTSYILHGDKSLTDINDLHHISHCENIECFSNVKLLKYNGCNLKEMRNSGYIKNLLDAVII